MLPHVRSFAWIMVAPRTGAKAIKFFRCFYEWRLSVIGPALQSHVKIQRLKDQAPNRRHAVAEAEAPRLLSDTRVHLWWSPGSSYELARRDRATFRRSRLWTTAAGDV